MRLDATADLLYAFVGCCILDKGMDKYKIPFQIVLSIYRVIPFLILASVYLM